MKLFLMFTILCGLAYGKDSLDIKMKLKTLNKPALKTIKSEDEYIIDCIDIYKQHAFDHPALRDHKIQMKPSFEFDSKKTTIPNNDKQNFIFQTWSKSGSCPDGTIPVRRVSREDINIASSLSRFGKKTHSRYSFLHNALQEKTNFNFTAPNINAPTSPDRSEAIVATLGYNYNGAQSDINVWNPPRVQAGEYSTAQIWLFAGLSDSFESVEAGWANDGYTKTGCFDLLCSGFVQTTIRFALGAAIEPVSTRDSPQYDIRVGIFLDPNNKNWWLTCANVVVGYWPRKLFEVLSHSAIAVQWGGEVYSPNVKKRPHTRAAMGSGEWPYYLYGSACFHTNLRIKDNSLQIKYPEYLFEYSAEEKCYYTKLHRDNYMAEPRFFFGGPGQNPECP